MNNKITIKNLGPVKFADINVSPLTVFIGPNSSGKSFSALLIHSLLNSFNQLGFNQYDSIRHKSVKLFLENNDESFNEFKQDLIRYVKTKPKLTDNSFKFPIDKFKLIIKDSFGCVFNDFVEKRLEGNFNKDLNKLNRLNKFSFEFSFNGNDFINNNGKLVLNKFNVNMADIKNEGLSGEDNRICFFKINEEFLLINLDYILWHKFFEKDTKFPEIIFMMIISSIMDIFNHNSYYIPASGNNILKNLNEHITSDLNGILNHSNVQHELMTNFLKVKNELEKGHFYNLAKQLEQEMIEGTILLRNDEINEEFVFIDEKYDMELELDLTSSSVRVLTPIIIYLKYFLKKGDTVIIEEPENHIHPKNQLILVKYLVKAINQGLNIIITTHSDYIVEKFNNFIRLGSANNEIFDKLGYDESNILDYGDVNIYNFKNVDKYTYVADSVDINETGFDENSFYDVNNELYDESIDIIEANMK